MVMSLLHVLPTELVLHILSYLPVRDILRFSQLNHEASSLASSSLHTLRLGVYPSKLASLISRLASISPQSFPTTSKPRMILFDPSSYDTNPSSDPHTVSVILPEVAEHDPETLLSFHTTLLSSVVDRYHGSLSDLDLSIWSLTPPIAAALAKCHNLKSLNIRVENPYMRARGIPTPRTWNRRANHEGWVDHWECLTASTAFGRLESLRLDGAVCLKEEDLLRILHCNEGIRELWLTRCPAVGSGLVQFLGEFWGGRTYLRSLGVISCGEVSEDALKFLAGTPQLQVSSCLDG